MNKKNRDYTKPGKCFMCGKDTFDYRCCVNNGEDDYMCEECINKVVKKKREEWREAMNKKVVPFLIENNFKVIVTHDFDEKVEEYPIKDYDVFYCVDIIRERMKDEYYESWIDVGCMERKGVDFEIVSWMFFTNKKTKEELGFNFKVVGNVEWDGEITYY